MNREPVESTNIAAIGYDALSQRLEVEFRNGRVYSHYDVTADEYAALMASESKGRYFNNEIKPSHDFIMHYEKEREE